MSLKGIGERRKPDLCGQRRGLIIGRMVIDMNEAQVRTLEQVRQVVEGTQTLEFKRSQDSAGRYEWISEVLRRFEYRRLKRPERGVLRAYLQRFSGYSRAQITRLVGQWVEGKTLVKRYRAPEHAFAQRYTRADTVLLAEVDRAMNTLSGPATACVLRRQRDQFGDARFERLGALSVGHLYNLRASASYRARRVTLTKTRPVKANMIGVRKAPAPDARPGFIRIDSVHQGDLDGVKGLYHINAVDCVTQWQVVASVQAISEAHLLSVIEEMLAQFPFEILGFHADNGSEYVNHKVARLLDKLRIEFTRSRPRHSNDNGLAETKNGAVVRKIFGYAHIAQRFAERINAFNVRYLVPFINLHRPCLFATERSDPNKPGRIRKIYRHADVMTPLEKLASLDPAKRNLRGSVSLAQLQAQARATTDLEAAAELNKARQQLFAQIHKRA